MFTHLIVTAPTEKAAEVYRFQLNDLKGQLKALADSHLYCVADPCGDRVGSGGGTLNAIHYLFEICGAETILSDSKILIIHSGGDSRRIPIHSGVSSQITFYVYVLQSAFTLLSQYVARHGRL